MAERGLARPSVEINDEVIEIKPNSLSYKGGAGEITVRRQSAGGGAGSNVITKDAESEVAMVKFSLISTASNAARVEQWGRLSEELNGVVIRLTDAGLTKVFRQARLTTDPEIAIGADADYEVVFEGDPAT